MKDLCPPHNFCAAGIFKYPLFEVIYAVENFFEVIYVVDNGILLVLCELSVSDFHMLCIFGGIIYIDSFGSFGPVVGILKRHARKRTAHFKGIISDRNNACRNNYVFQLSTIGKCA